MYPENVTSGASVQVVNEKEREPRAPKARERENQGAEGVGSGVSPLQWGRGLTISFFDFFSGNGAGRLHVLMLA